MQELNAFFQENLTRELISGIFSNPKSDKTFRKIRIRPLEKNKSLYFQFEQFTDTQVFHENLSENEALAKCTDLMMNFRQLQLKTRSAESSVLVSKKGKVTLRSRKTDPGAALTSAPELSHNRRKHYILEEGTCVPFLQDLGIMTSDGRIVHSRYDKFRQINRFLEFIEDILPALDQGRELTILDFGCGKSYLTFAMYYYLHELKHYDIRIIGLDLKQDVIRHCNELAKKYGYEKLSFLIGDVADYQGTDSIDMMVTLHACDTATDYALARAVQWNARVILSVPCCQHELNRQVQNTALAPILKYGILKERFSALLTDGLRAQYLEQAGYDTQILEFIDLEHTPKNLLIRAVKPAGKIDYKKGNSAKAIRDCEELLHVSPTLGKLLFPKEKPEQTP